MISCVRHGLN